MRRGKIGFWYRFAVCVVKPPMLVSTRRDWRGRENIPRTGGVIVAVNHLSYADPFMVAHFVYDSGRLPRFMAKVELFRMRFAGRVVRGAGQIPVLRHTSDAAGALAAAVEALRRGECVVIYPEGTVTKDPDYWPMRAKTGVARLALLSGAPVVPVAQWGAQEVMGRDKKLHAFPRHTVRFVAGPPIHLPQVPATAESLRTLTDTVMGAIRRQLGELRGAEPPEQVFDPRPAGVAEPRRAVGA